MELHYTAILIIVKLSILIESKEEQEQEKQEEQEEQEQEEEQEEYWTTLGISVATTGVVYWLTGYTAQCPLISKHLN